MEVPAGFDAGRFRLTGNVSGEAAFSRAAGSSRLGSGEMRTAHLDRQQRIRPRNRPGRSGNKVGCMKRSDWKCFPRSHAPAWERYDRTFYV